MIFSDGFGPLPLDFAYVGIFAVVVTAICVVLSREIPKQVRARQSALFPFFVI